ncbi:MAG: hypothetical protein ACREU3_01050 [Steroidobacteraceae bacterium]
MLGSIADQASRQLVWRRWLGERLTEELLAKITGIVEARSELVLFAESASWGARLRYALADLHAELAGAQPPIERVRVRVLPRRSSS